LEAIDIKKLFDYKLPTYAYSWVNVSPHPVNWTVFISTTMDTLPTLIPAEAQTVCNCAFLIREDDETYLLHLIKQFI
jgi:hypothetical protein